MVIYIINFTTTTQQHSKLTVGLLKQFTVSLEDQFVGFRTWVAHFLFECPWLIRALSDPKCHVIIWSPQSNWWSIYLEVAYVSKKARRNKFIISPISAHC